MSIPERSARTVRRMLRSTCGAATATALLACSGPIRTDPMPSTPAAITSIGAIRVTNIQPAQSQDAQSPAPEQASLVRACKAWRLSAADATRFFTLAREYPDGLGDGYYWLPCSIKGRLLADGRAWDFEINAAATATWRDGETTRRWGCSDRACAPMALLMPDGNDP